ncbi:MAG: protein translocase subunit SecD, partial [Alteromonadales bacterium]|nr:protein translocase subunit SecD [Alteromonadales bacterium]
MMNSRKTKHARHAKWQNIVITFILLFMLISALPNLYSDKVSIHLAKNSTQNEKISPQDINNLLASNNLAVDEIKSSSDDTTIILKNKTDQHSIESLLMQKFGDTYSIESSIENDAPIWLKSLEGKPIKLGLDLSGGVLFVLDVDTERALSDRVKSIALDVKSLALEKRIRLSKVEQQDNYSIVINYPSTKQSVYKDFLTKIKKNYPELTQNKLDENQITLAYSAQEQVKFRQETMKQTLKTMRGRIEELGITEAVTQKQGKNRIRIELPGVHDPEEAKRIIGATASLDFYQMAEHSKAAGILQMTDENGRKLRMNSKVVFSGSSIKNARSGQDEMGMPLVNLTLDSVGGKKMSTFSKKNIGKPMVTVFSEFYHNTKNEMVKKSKVINVATIQQHLGSQFSITNMSSPQAAQELALLLRAGSLTAPVTVVQQRSIEATLGADNIDNGIKALTIGISFTLLFMAFWYRTLGIIANVALA